MGIWFTKIDVGSVSKLSTNTMAENIGIEITEITENSLKGKMPVDHRTIQPKGILHGGASVALAETIGSIASSLVIDNSKYFCVGLEINANHLRPVSSGFVYCEAKPIHIGRKTHVWNIEIKNEEGKMVCISRFTVSILELGNKN